MYVCKWTQFKQLLGVQQLQGTKRPMTKVERRRFRDELEARRTELLLEEKRRVNERIKVRLCDRVYM